MIGQTSECNIYPLCDWLAIVLHAYIALVDAARNAFLLGTSTAVSFQSSMCCRQPYTTHNHFHLLGKTELIN